MPKRDFLSLLDLSADEIRALIDRAKALKADRYGQRTLPGRTLGMIFEKSSTRTRVSFEAGMVQLGGGSIFLSPSVTQLGRGEPVEDTARVIGRMCDAVMIRNDSHADQALFAKYCDVPVINGLSDLLHPCQILADLLTLDEHLGRIEGLTVAWVGDGNNVCHSWAYAAHLLGFTLTIATPAGYEADAQVLKTCGDAVQVMPDAAAAVRGANVVVTDVWASMGQESEQAEREAAFDGYQVNDALMSHADDQAIFLHCLPAHRGEEVSASVIDGAQSAVWDEAENRLHAQKALVELLLT